MILQLNPPLPLNTPKGEGLAHFVIDYGPEHNLQWVVFITETGECWTYSNTVVRACKNITFGRTLNEMPKNIKELTDAIKERRQTRLEGV